MSDYNDIIADDIESEFQEDSDITLQQILNALISYDKNLDLKTEIYRPKSLAALNVVQQYLKQKKFTKSAETIGTFIDVFLKYMVSYKRQSRSEIVKAFQFSNEALKATLSISDKLTSNLKE
ncbi:MAG: hypothetical protein ACOC1X_00325 [Promethearchaeota archaeon]